MRNDAVNTLLHFLDQFRPPSPRPILWVGDSASAVAGYPTSSEIEEKLRARFSSGDRTGGELIDGVVAEWGLAALQDFLETQLGGPHRFADIHASIARLAGAGLFAAIVTTNHDELIEDALKAADIHYVPQILEHNFVLQARAEVQVLKIRGSRTDWASVILRSRDRAHAGMPLLTHGFIGRRSTLHRIRRLLKMGSDCSCSRGSVGWGRRLWRRISWRRCWRRTERTS